ncbi:DUF3572 domain-containing protein [Microbacteriaceae bacterium K1510]|nr:DUF3572 domain-containing protein [Microbacteriaceae bacterium K1510]
MAIQALTYIASDPERLGQFLAITGVGPAEIRSASTEPGFLRGVLEYLVSDEALLTGFAAEAGFRPEDPVKALVALGGSHWEREVP